MGKLLHGFLSAAIALLVMTTAGIFLTACNDAEWTGPSDDDQSPSGFYTGSFTSTVTSPSPSRQAIGIISEAFDTHVLLANQHYAGNVAVDDIDLSGNLVEYRGRQGVFLGFDGLARVSLVGEITERDGMFGTYAGEGAEGRFALTYNVAYEDGSSLDLLSGLWTYSQASSGGAVYMLTLELDDSGQLFGSDTAGCVFSGQLNLIDDRYSAYRASISVSTCGDVDGDYSGLAFYPSATAAEFLYLGTDNGQFALATQLGRL